MTAYYNEHDKYAAQWLRNLIAQKLIAPGDVDERSIVDVQPDDLKGYVQCHFFAGIGGWSLAARLAHIPDDEPLWTGSCPCQPFSGAGKQQGTADARHLWPEYRRLIAHRRPAVVAGEQVASKLGREWLAGVRADLEGLDYAVGAADLCAAGARAPHIRQRLFWLADGRIAGDGDIQPGGQHGQQPQDGRVVIGLAQPARRQRDRKPDGKGRLVDRSSPRRVESDGQPERNSAFVRLGNTGSTRTGGYAGTALSAEARSGGTRSADGFDGRNPPVTAGTADFWSTYDVVHCTDGKARRFEPSSFPLAHGVPNRVGRLRGYGNAIVPQVAAEFLKAAFDSLQALDKA